MLRILRFLAPIWVLIFLGCSSAPKEEVDYSLVSINAAVESQLTMGIQKKSENGRVYHTRPFVVKQTDEFNGKIYRERGRAKVEVGGDRRPYTIEVTVVIERAKAPHQGLPQDSEYSEIRTDNGLAKKLLSNIKNALERRGQYKNFIDDFRPF